MNNEEQNQQQPENQQEGQAGKQNQDNDSKVTFTEEQQAAVNELIAKQVAKERARAEQEAEKQRQEAEQARKDAVKKAEERAKMSADERAKAEQEDREKAFAKKQADLDRKMREISTKSLLLDKGISSDMLPLVMGADDDETSQRLDLLKQYTDKKIQEATEKLMAGKKAPSAGNDGGGAPLGSNPWSKQGWNLTQQNQILTTNPEQARQMIAQAKPTEGFYFGKN